MLMWKRDSSGENLDTERPVRESRDYCTTAGDTWHFCTLVEVLRMGKRDEFETPQKAAQMSPDYPAPFLWSPLQY